jgi:hypothetical protein
LKCRERQLTHDGPRCSPKKIRRTLGCYR